MELNERINEIETKNSQIIEIDQSLHEVCKSICKISYYNDKKIGSGFLIQLYKDDKILNCLMTNYHVINEKLIEAKEMIDIKYNYEKYWLKIKLDKSERFIFYDMKYDFIIIEIVPNDNIKEKYFLKPNVDNNNYTDKEIYIPQFPQGKNLSYSQGKIIIHKDFEIFYDASTKDGSSGSPILLKNSTEVIGIHKSGNKKRKRNYGTFIISIMQLLQTKKEDELTNKFPNKLLNEFYENGDYYIGESKNGKKHGKGTIYYNKGNIK